MFEVKKGRLYCSGTDMRAVFGLSAEMISRFVKAGMPHKQINKRDRRFCVPDCIEWYTQNEVEKLIGKIDKSMDSADLEEIEKMSNEQLNRAIKIYQAKKLKHESNIKRIDEQVLKGKYIDSSEVDEIIASVATTLISELKKFAEIIPKKTVAGIVRKVAPEATNDIVMKAEEEAEAVIDDEIEKMIENMRKKAEEKLV